MGVFDGVLLLTSMVYLTVMYWLWLGLGRLQTRRGEGAPSVSVVLAARNEAQSIGPCLEALRRQEYAGEWEVVVVNDRSEDATGAIIAQKAADWPALSLVEAPAKPQYHCPKKSALSAGIAASSGEILLFTDADCRPEAGWIGAMVAGFGPGVGLVAGWAEPEPAPGLWSRLLALDNMAVGALSAGSLGMGSGLACTGRNLAYRRQVYHQLDGFASIGHLLGGDDVYFMRLVQQRTDWQLVFRGPKGGGVRCQNGPLSGKEILHQKLRHAAKAGNYTGWALVLGVVVYLYHLFLAFGLIKLVLGQGGALVGALWAGRWLVDATVLWRFAALGFSRGPLVGLPLMEILYIPYVLFFTVAGRLGWFRWKG